jgi:hypothetical protein
MAYVSRADDSPRALWRTAEQSEVKPIRWTRHAQEQCVERGATESEVREAIRRGTRQPAKQGRTLCRFNFPYGRLWQGKLYAIKQVAPVIVEETHEIVVITVYTFYF